MFKENIEAYNQFVTRLTSLPARIDGRAGKSMKQINAYLLTAVKEKTEEKVIEAWELILNSYEHWDSFHKKQIELHQINSNLINIINSIKNGRKQTTNSKQLDRDNLNAEALRILREQQHGFSQGS